MKDEEDQRGFDGLVFLFPFHFSSLSSARISDVVQHHAHTGQRNDVFNMCRDAMSEKVGKSIDKPSRCSVSFPHRSGSRKLTRRLPARQSGSMRF